MLVEFDHVRQIPGEDQRRLFIDQDFHLYVWYRNGEISGFELCYDLRGTERAVLWRGGKSVSHYAVDDGERPGQSGQTPVFSAKAAPVGPGLVEDFRKAALQLEEEILSVVEAGLKLLTSP